MGNTIKVRPVRQSIRRTEINIRRGWQPDRFPFSKSCRLTYGGRGSMRFSISCRPNVGPRKQLWKCRCVLMFVIGMQVTDTLMLHPLYSFARMPRMAQGSRLKATRSPRGPRTPPDVLLLRKISECAVLLWEELYH